ncbi:MAG: universal stress protein [Candidatus Hydrogenedentes bacterium]|nr:universal stress protein [Candidatus Hydrogenedentota bacterium]
MIKRILVTTDGSESAEIGVRCAVTIAKAQNASLVVLYVTDIKLLEGPFLRDLTASLGAAPYVNYQGNIALLLDERGKNALSHAESLCEELGVACKTLQQTGIVPRVICENAELADLIVMGRAGEHNKFLEGLIGSTVEAVVRRASVPVLITGHDVLCDGDVVLPYDGSAQAKKALRAGALFAAQHKNKIRVLVVDTPENCELLEAAQSYLQNRELDVDYSCRQGDPGAEIVSFAKSCNAALIIMGAYGHNKLRELVLGSTTSYTINHAPCPVLLVR